MSLAMIEAELKPKVVETFDKIASSAAKLRRVCRNFRISPTSFEAKLLYALAERKYRS